MSYNEVDNDNNANNNMNSSAKKKIQNYLFPPKKNE